MRPRPRLIAAVASLALIMGACSSDAQPSLEAVGPPTPTVSAGVAVTPTPAAEADGEEPTDQLAEDAPNPPATATPAPSATPTPEPGAATPSVPTPTVQPSDSPTATPEPEPSPGCTSGLAGDPDVTNTGRADLDGDGAPDQVTTYRIAGGGWHVRVDTAAGESLDSPLPLPTLGDTNVTPLGGADVDGDGAAEELFTVVGSGASVLIVAVLTRVGCELVQATTAGAPIAFPVGGGIGNIGGLTCLDTDGNGVNNTVVAWSGLADFDAPEGTYRVDGVEYELRGSEFRAVATRSLVAKISEADFVYGQLTCGDVNL